MSNCIVRRSAAPSSTSFLPPEQSTAQQNRAVFHVFVAEDASSARRDTEQKVDKLIHIAARTVTEIPRSLIKFLIDTSCVGELPLFLLARLHI